MQIIKKPSHFYLQRCVYRDNNSLNRVSKGQNNKNTPNYSECTKGYSPRKPRWEDKHSLTFSPKHKQETTMLNNSSLTNKFHHCGSPVRLQSILSLRMCHIDLQRCAAAAILSLFFYTALLERHTQRYTQKTTAVVMPPSRELKKSKTWEGLHGRVTDKVAEKGVWAWLKCRRVPTDVWEAELPK